MKMRSTPILFAAMAAVLIRSVNAQDGSSVMPEVPSVTEEVGTGKSRPASGPTLQHGAERLTQITPGEPLDLEMKPGEVRRFAYTPTLRGEVSIWARSDGLDPALDVRDADGKAIASDEDSGGWSSAHLVLEIEKGVALEIVVRTKARAAQEGEVRAGGQASDEGSPASCRLMVIETVRSEIIEALVLQLRSVSEEMEALIAKGEYGEARARGREVLESPLPPVEGRPSNLSAALHGLGYQVWIARDIETASRAWAAALDVRERTLPEEHPDLQKTRTNRAIALGTSGDLAGARALEERVLEVFERTLPEDHPHLQTIRVNLASTLKSFGDLAGARALEEQVLAVRERTLPEAHPSLQEARMSYASTLFGLGDLETARSLQENVLSVRERTLPVEHPDLQRIRMNYANTLYALGDLERAQSLQKQVLAIWERTLPAEHRDLQGIRMNYAATLSALGDVAGARALEEHVLAIWERTLPPEHPDLQRIRVMYAGTLHALGDLTGARALLEQVLAVRERTLPAEHPHLQSVRGSYGTLLYALGDLAGARALFEQVISVYEKTLPAEHPDLQTIRMNCAVTLAALGDLSGARALEEQVLSVSERTLPADHPGLQTIRMNYATRLHDLGDLAGARALFAQVLSVRERTLPAEHPDLQSIRMNYAVTLAALGDPAGARALQEQVLSVWERTLPAEHLDLQTIRINYAVTLRDLGDLAAARALLEQVLAVGTRTLPRDHPKLQMIRMNLAVILKDLGNLGGARVLEEQVLEVWERTLPAEHPDLQLIRMNYAWTLHHQFAAGDIETGRLLADHVAQFLEVTKGASALWEASLSRREVSLWATEGDEVVDRALSFVRGGPGSERTDPLAFLLAEDLRAMGLRTLRLRTLAESATAELSEAIARRRAELHRASRALEGFIASPELPKDAAEDETIDSRLAALVREREEKERALSNAMRDLPGAERFLREVGLEEIAAALPEGAVGVSFTGYTRWTLIDPKRSNSNSTSKDCLVAFLIDEEAGLSRIELGPLETITGEIERWRALVGKPLGNRGVEIDETSREAALKASGRRLRELILDPVIAAAKEGRGDGKAPQRLVAALVPELQVLDIAALPWDENSVVGDHLALDIVQGLSWLAREGVFEPGPARLLALGDVDFLGKPRALDDEEAEVFAALRGAREAKGQPVWKEDFRELPFTEVEVRAIAKSFERAFDDEDVPGYEEPFILRGRRADKARLRALAPRARYLHLATHGWFAPESVPSILDRRKTRDGIQLVTTDFRDEVRGYLPLSLCGLALTGANLPPNADGSHPGLLSGVEIAELDLSSCELAVLSACETNVGVRRAGQGIASLQEALFMAGARNSITSLWRVPDEATMELMTRFYEGIWRRGETNRDALWNAKKKLRDAKDSRTGKPLYGLKDWAGWVLVGQPE